MRTVGVLLIQRLAPGAEIGAAVADGYPLDRGAAVRADLAAEPMGDPELKVGGALFTAGTVVGVHAGPFMVNRRREHLPDALIEPSYFFYGQAAPWP